MYEICTQTRNLQKRPETNNAQLIEQLTPKPKAQESCTTHNPQITHREKCEAAEYKQSEDYIIYADGAKFIIQEELGRTISMIAHYSLLTNKRGVKIHRGKARILTRG